MTTPLTWIEKVVGVFVTLILALLAAALFVTAQRRQLFEFEKPLVVKTIVDRGYELKPGASVLINEVEAGSVSDVALADDGRVILTIRVEGRFKQHVGKPAREVGDARGSAVIVDRPPIGSPKINITAAHPEERYSLKSFPDEVYLDATVPPSVLDKLAGVKDDIGAVKDQVISTLEDVKAIIENVRATTEPLAKGRGTVGKLLHDEEMARSVQQMVADARDLTANLKAVSEDLRAVSAEVKPRAHDVLTEVDAAVHQASDTLKTLDALLADVMALVATVTKALGEAEAIVHNIRMATDGLPEIVRKSDRALAEANRVIDSLKRNILIRGNLDPVAAPPREAEAVPRGGPPEPARPGSGAGRP